MTIPTFDNEEFRVSVEDGKYTAVVLKDGVGTLWYRHGEEWPPATNDWAHAKAINALLWALHEANQKLGIAPNRAETGADGSVRKAHYGTGKQPWDTGLERGWAPGASAFNVVRYLRRSKLPEHSIESARWYYSQILQRAPTDKEWSVALVQLEDELTFDELKRLRGK